MRINADGYSLRYNHSEVRAVARKLARAIPKILEATGATAVVVHGTSGISAGFAALAFVDFNIVMVRKDNDSSHGSPIEGTYGHILGKYIILDDFVSSGGTVGRIISKIGDMAFRAKNQYEAPSCVGLLTYKPVSGSGHENCPVPIYELDNLNL